MQEGYFQIHVLESEDGRAATRKLSRRAMRKFFSEIEPCVVGMEACGSAHYYWTRELRAIGHEVRHRRSLLGGHPRDNSKPRGIH